MSEKGNSKRETTSIFMVILSTRSCSVKYLFSSISLDKCNGIIVEAKFCFNRVFNASISNSKSTKFAPNSHCKFNVKSNPFTVTLCTFYVSVLFLEKGLELLASNVPILGNRSL